MRMLKRMHRLGDRRAIETWWNASGHAFLASPFARPSSWDFPARPSRRFEELKQYVEQAEFDRVAAFLYSDEEKTRRSRS